jgi:hypothetical protein
MLARTQQRKGRAEIGLDAVSTGAKQSLFTKYIALIQAENTRSSYLIVGLSKVNIIFYILLSHKLKKKEKDGNTKREKLRRKPTNGKHYEENNKGVRCSSIDG